MILSHKYRFIFVKCRKTAGTSIEAYLSPLCGPDDVVTPVIPPVEAHQPRNHTGRFNPLREIVDMRGQGLRRTLKDWRRGNRFYNHIPSRRLRARIPREVWRRYTTFCVERNPWDKVLSDLRFKNRRREKPLSLDDYLETCRPVLNYPQYTDARGEHIIVDRILRYEHLTEELSGVFDELGVPFDGQLGVRAKATRRPEDPSYRDVFDAAQRRRVEEIFAPEIRLHGYAF